MNTGTRLFWMIGFTVVGKPAASVITSSPAWRRRSPSFGEVSAATATRLADDPELTSTHSRIPNQRANSFSNCSANRPVVSQKSSDESTSRRISEPSNTLPEIGTGVSPGTKSRGGKASAQYSPTKSRISRRNSCLRCVTQELPVPGYGALQPLLQRKQRRPVQHLPGPFGSQVLVTDFIRRLIAQIGLQGRPHRPQDAAHQVQHGHLDFIREIERHAAQFGPTMEQLSQQHVSCGAVFHVEIVTDGMPVG